MKIKSSLLYPFDLGLELDFSGGQTQTLLHQVAIHDLPKIYFEDRAFQTERVETHLFRFGVGMTQIFFEMDTDLDTGAKLAIHSEKILIGTQPLLDWCEEQTQRLLGRAEIYATHRYDLRYPEKEIFPVYVLSPSDVKHADQFLKRHYKALYGICSGEAQFEDLSNFVFERDPIINFGYYENELIVSKRFGAVLSSAESATVIDLIALSYAQYWSLKSYQFVLAEEMSAAQKHLNDLPPYYKFWKIPKSYQRFSQDALDFGKDKLSILDSIYNVSLNLPKIELDWHLRTVYKDMTQVFNSPELYKTVDTELGRIEETYNQAREFLSTNFFILLDIIFALWLVWGVFDTILLLAIARK